MTDYDDHRRFLALVQDLKDVLAAAMTQRDQRQELVETPSGPEVGWVLFERQAMVDAVNLHRSRAGLAPVSTADVERVESQAEGHVDYHAKFALYCAELVADRTRTVW